LADIVLRWWQSFSGLLSIYAKLRELYAKWSDVISLADYVVLAARQAVLLAIDLDNSSTCNNNICVYENKFGDFQVGRQTCSDPDNGETQVLPQGHDIHSVFMLQGEFDLSAKESVALLGKILTILETLHCASSSGS